jgi:hypothetical protein
LMVTQLLVARGDLPGRVVRDILDVIYHPRFARDLQYEIREDSGRIVGGLPLHPAADFYYHRNDLVTAERLGRFSLVASAIAALVATIQFMTRLRRRAARRVQAANRSSAGDQRQTSDPDRPDTSDPLDTSDRPRPAEQPTTAKQPTIAD